MEKKTYITPQCDEILIEHGFRLLAGSVETDVDDEPAETNAFARELQTEIEDGQSLEHGLFWGNAVSLGNPIPLILFVLQLPCPFAHT